MSVEELKALADELSETARSYPGVTRTTEITEVGRKGKKSDEIVRRSIVIEVTQTVDKIKMTSGKNKFDQDSFISPDVVLTKIHELLDLALDGGLRGDSIVEPSAA